MGGMKADVDPHWEYLTVPVPAGESFITTAAPYHAKGWLLERLEHPTATSTVLHFMRRTKPPTA